ncbi:hypothetical protein V2I80_08030, partial [Pseudomonas viridiflava]|uniref:hypothetical protein n=1 Tax=Pseudomonas viridiflava TaxID=33069 RepID=UPI002EB2814D|nr:hypothetical protein [Pseudomonas viridiflava]MEE3972077.1 hypothetical protein [Pseudomonas viridiflava]MEE4017171.1 hypothetical protein [Pseudomonas viridiflava]MEE4045388.1 hypothetical protein [Pseudomonas viridiflava]
WCPPIFGWTPSPQATVSGRCVARTVTISELHFLRTATQFESLRWFADSLAAQVEVMRGEEPQEVQDGDPFLMEVPKEWLSAKDSF